jgi:hypothetical protein
MVQDLRNRLLKSNKVGNTCRRDFQWDFPQRLLFYGATGLMLGQMLGNAKGNTLITLG